MRLNYFLNSSHHRKVAFEEAMNVGLFPLWSNNDVSYYYKRKISIEAMQFFALANLRVACLDYMIPEDHYYNGELELELGITAYDAARRLSISLFNAKRKCYSKYTDEISYHIKNDDFQALEYLFLGSDGMKYDDAFAWMVSNDVISFSGDKYVLNHERGVCKENPKIMLTMEQYSSAFA